MSSNESQSSRDSTLGKPEPEEPALRLTIEYRKDVPVDKTTSSWKTQVSGYCAKIAEHINDALGRHKDGPRKIPFEAIIDDNHFITSIEPRAGFGIGDIDFKIVGLDTWPPRPPRLLSPNPDGKPNKITLAEGYLLDANSMKAYDSLIFYLTYDRYGKLLTSSSKKKLSMQALQDQ